MDKEVAKLWLYENTLTTTVTSIGYKDAAQTRYTWFVDMRQVLGETLWSKYDAFLVQLTAQARINAVPYVYVDGLNLTQTSKNGAQQGGSALIATLTQPYGTSQDRVWDSYADNFLYTMIKPADNRIELSIYWLPMTGANGTSTTGSWFFTFQGLKKYNPLYRNPFNTFYNLEQRTFTLSTFNLIPGGTNEIGTMNSTYSNFTFFNINMRNLLGTMWNKYTKFNITMTTWGTGGTMSSLNGDQRNVYLTMEGLQFINTLAVGPYTAAWYNRFGWGAQGILEATTASYPNGNAFGDITSTTTFRKPESENVNLNFVVGNLNNGYASTSITYNNWTITFRVVGVSESDQ